MLIATWRYLSVYYSVLNLLKGIELSPHQRICEKQETRHFSFPVILTTNDIYRVKLMIFWKTEIYSASEALHCEMNQTTRDYLTITRNTKLWWSSIPPDWDTDDVRLQECKFRLCVHDLEEGCGEVKHLLRVAGATSYTHVWRTVQIATPVGELTAALVKVKLSVSVNLEKLA